MRIVFLTHVDAFKLGYAHACFKHGKVDQGIAVTKPQPDGSNSQFELLHDAYDTLPSEAYTTTDEEFCLAHSNALLQFARTAGLVL